MDKGLIISLIGLGVMIAIGLSLAVYNIRDEEGRQRRIEARREQRKRRKKICAWF